jgi:hypothetical protein
METIDEQLEELFERADKIAIDEVIVLARRVLKLNPSTHEFIMAMGSFFFTRKGEHNAFDNYSLEREIKGLRGGSELWDFIIKHDNRFKITGNPIRFSLKSRIKTDW